ncbi:MAG: choice-of-anchor D domain-containing protein, partial [Pirellulales bacterium]
VQLTYDTNSLWSDIAAGAQPAWSSASDGYDQFDIGISGAVVPPPEPQMSVSDGWLPVYQGTTDTWQPVLATASDQQTYTVSNYGDATLTLAPASLVLPAGFSVVGSFPTSISPGQSADVTLALNTATPGNFGGAVSFDTNDPAHDPFQFFVSADVLPPPAIEVFDGSTQIAAGTGSDDFGSTPVGQPLTESFEIENTGTTSVTIDTGSLSVPYGFSVATPLPSSLAAGLSATFAIEFNATYTGSYGGSVSFSDSDTGNNPYTFQITATASQPPSIDVQASVPDASLPENTSGQFTVTRSGDTSSTLTIPFSVSGSAVSGTDYDPIGSSVTFAAGLTTATISVTPISGDYFTVNRTVVLTLASPTDSSYELGWPTSATVT